MTKFFNRVCELLLNLFLCQVLGLHIELIHKEMGLEIVMVHMHYDLHK